MASTRPPRYDARLAYPSYDKPFLHCWDGLFEAVFVAFHPFARLDGRDPFVEGLIAVPQALGLEAKVAYERASQVGRSEATGSKLDAAIDRLTSGAKLLSAYDAPQHNNGEEPTATELVQWSSVAEGSGLKSVGRVCRALLGMIGGIRADLVDERDVNALVRYCEKNSVFLPSAGTFQPLMIPAIDQWLRRGSSTSLVYQREFDSDPCEVFEANDDLIDIVYRGSLYDLEKCRCVVVDWDSFFSIFAGTDSAIAELIERHALDGFRALPETTHRWWLKCQDAN